MKKLSSIIIAAISGAMGVFVVYLAFVFPKTIEAWQEQGVALSVIQNLLVESSRVCSSFALVILPILAIIFLGSCIYIARGSRLMCNKK